MNHAEVIRQAREMRFLCEQMRRDCQQDRRDSAILVAQIVETRLQLAAEKKAWNKNSARLLGRLEEEETPAEAGPT